MFTTDQEEHVCVLLYRRASLSTAARRRARSASRCGCDACVFAFSVHVQTDNCHCFCMYMSAVDLLQPHLFSSYCFPPFRGPQNVQQPLEAALSAFTAAANAGLGDDSDDDDFFSENDDGDDAAGADDEEETEEEVVQGGGEREGLGRFVVGARSKAGPKYSRVGAGRTICFFYFFLFLFISLLDACPCCTRPKYSRVRVLAADCDV